MSETHARLLSVLVSLISAAIALYSAYRARLSARETRKLQLYAYRRDNLKELRLWSERVLRLMGEAVYLCDLNPARSPGTFFEARHRLRIEFSIVLDEGRWFLPNLEPNAHGTHKPAAFRGFRQEELNAIAATLGLMDQTSYMDQKRNLALRTPLVDQKRIFTTEIQGALDPRAREAELNELLQQVTNSGS